MSDIHNRKLGAEMPAFVCGYLMDGMPCMAPAAFHFLLDDMECIACCWDHREMVRQMMPVEGHKVDVPCSFEGNGNRWVHATTSSESYCVIDEESMMSLAAEVGVPANV